MSDDVKAPEPCFAPCSLRRSSQQAFRRSRGRRHSAQQPSTAKPNILVIFGDDVGQIQHQRLYPRAGGLQDAQYRPHRQGRHDVHRLLCGEQLHGGPLDLHHGAGLPANGALQGRHSRRAGRPAGSRYNDRPGAQAARLCDGPVRQEPSRRPRRIPADQARLRRILRQPLSPQCRGGARAALLSQERRHIRQGELAARRAQGVRRRQDRRHRPAQQEADGDGR